MKLTINNNYGKFDTKQIFNNEKAVIDVEHDYRFFNLIALISNGTNYSQVVKIVDNQLILDKNLLKPGKLYVKIKVMQGTNVIKLIPCDSLIVKEQSKDVEVIPQIAECCEKIANLETSIKKILKVINAICNINLTLNDDDNLKGASDE